MEHFLEALSIFLRWDTLLLSFGAASLGMIVGAIPGISGGMTMILFLPLTFALPPMQSMALLCSIYVGGVSGGYIGSILLGVPGEPGSVATVYDGYEFTKKGDPVPALSAATIANFIGTIPGVLLAMAICNVIAPWVVKLGPWELFAFGASAIVMISSLSEGSMTKNLLAGAIGLLVTCVGFAPVSGTQRFTFGTYLLSGGFDRVNVILGIYAGRVIFLEYVRGERFQDTSIKVSRFRMTLKEIKDNAGNILRSLGLGIWIGFLPGLGSNLANVVAYATQKKFSKHPETFGKGNIEGVWAPEVANNATIGGAFIPTIALGIPGSGSMAYLLMGLMIVGVEPGPLLMQNEPTLVYLIYITIIVGACGLLIFQMFFMPLFPLMLRTPYHILYPTILALCFVGAYVSIGNISSSVIFILCTLLGIWFNYAGIPAVTFVIAFILGDILEINFRNAMALSPDLGWRSFFVRPISCILIIFNIFLLFWPIIKKLILARNARLKAVIDQVGEDDD